MTVRGRAPTWREAKTRRENLLGKIRRAIGALWIKKISVADMVAMEVRQIVGLFIAAIVLVGAIYTYGLVWVYVVACLYKK